MYLKAGKAVWLYIGMHYVRAAKKKKTLSIDSLTPLIWKDRDVERAKQSDAIRQRYSAKLVTK